MTSSQFDASGKTPPPAPLLSASSGSSGASSSVFVINSGMAASIAGALLSVLDKYSVLVYQPQAALALLIEARMHELRWDASRIGTLAATASCFLETLAIWLPAARSSPRGQVAQCGLAVVLPTRRLGCRA